MNKKTTVWNKGMKKETNQSVRKISETMKSKKMDNFKDWREQMKRKGQIISVYKDLEKNADLAELIGVVLGDGNIYVHERTECLRIVSNSSDNGFVKRYSCIIKKVFGKSPSVRKRTSSNAINITFYERNISKRIGIPSGSKKDLRFVLPGWIAENKNNTKHFLRGLYETDGSYSIHKETSTYKFVFSNKNESLLYIVYNLLVSLGFHPHMSTYRVQISRRNEVLKIVNLLRFRSYDAG